jgi:hypothetical protein
MTPGVPQGNIVWLASYLKSGNTWLRAFLHNLFRDQDRPININELGGELVHSESAIGWYSMIDQRPPGEWSEEDMARMRPQVHELIARSQQGTVFCKTHSALMTVRGFPTVNLAVSAGAIYVIRNPLDVVISFADFQGVTLDVAIAMLATENFEIPAGGNQVTVALGSWSQHVASWTAADNERVHVVRYEDMARAPLKTFGGVAGYLGLKVPRARLERSIKHSSFKVLRAQEEKQGFTERSEAQARFFRKGEVDEWRKVLSEDQVRRLIDTHREQMARFGYLPKGF